MAGYGRIVTENFVFHYVLPRLNRVEEVGNVISGVVVSRSCCIVFHPAQIFRRLRMRLVPIIQILLLGCRSPAVQAVAFRLGAGVLRGHRQRVALDDQGRLRSVKDDWLPSLVVLIAVQVHRHAGIIVQRHQQVRIIAAIVEVSQAAR